MNGCGILIIAQQQIWILEARAANLLQPENLPWSCAFQAHRRVTDAIDGGRQDARQWQDVGRRDTPQLEKPVG